MLYLLISVLTSFTILYVLSKGKYNECLYKIDRKKYALKDFLPMTMFLLDLTRYRFNAHYDQSIQLKLGDLYDAEDSRFYLKIHWANKLALIMIMAGIIALFGMGVGEIDSSFLFFGAIALFLAFYLPDKEIIDKLNKKKMMLQIDFPDLLNKLVLLVSAGMTVSRAMEKIILDRQNEYKDSQRPLYENLRRMMLEIKSGKSETKAYEEFAKRCKVPEITKFASIIIQNSRKGSVELVSVLRLLAVECWELRKNAAKKLGEEASTKLLLPMMIMFIAILIIVISPAAMQFQGF